MDTVARLEELLKDRNLTVYRLAQICDIPYTTLRGVVAKHGQLSLDSIERICATLEIPIYEFFMTDQDWDEIESYALSKRRRKKSREETTQCNRIASSV